jgi:hypothetical protein
VIVETSDTGPELPTPLKTAGRGPRIGTINQLPIGVGTSNPWSELSTHTEIVIKIGAQVCDLCFSWLVSISIKHFDIFN